MTGHGGLEARGRHAERGTVGMGGNAVGNGGMLGGTGAVGSGGLVGRGGMLGGGGMFVGTGGGTLGMGGVAMGGAMNAGGTMSTGGSNAGGTMNAGGMAGTAGSGGSTTLGPYPAGPYGNTVGATLANLKLSGYLDEAGTGFATDQPWKDAYSLEDVRATGHALCTSRNSSDPAVSTRPVIWLRQVRCRRIWVSRSSTPAARWSRS